MLSFLWTAYKWKLMQSTLLLRNLTFKFMCEHILLCKMNWKKNNSRRAKAGPIYLFPLKHLPTTWRLFCQKVPDCYLASTLNSHFSEWLNLLLFKQHNNIPEFPLEVVYQMLMTFYKGVQFTSNLKPPGTC